MERLRLEARSPDPSTDFHVLHQVILGTPQPLEGGHCHPSGGSDTLITALGSCMSWAGAHHCSGPGSLAAFLCLCLLLECPRGLGEEVDRMRGEQLPWQGTSASINSYFPRDAGPLFQGLPARRQAAWAHFLISMRDFLGNMGSLFPLPTLLSGNSVGPMYTLGVRIPGVNPILET